MNRREIIQRSAQALAGLGGIALGVKAAQGDPIDLTRTATQKELHVTLLPKNTFMTFAPSSWRIGAAQRIVNESGEMWLAACERWLGHNPILIAFDDYQAVEVTRGNNHWTLIERVLTSEEIVGLDEYKRNIRPAFYRFPDHKTAPLPLVGAVLLETTYRLRGWIKNGRRPDWVMSIDGFKRYIPAEK